VIGRLTGKLLVKQAPELLVDIQGLGYEVLAPMSTFYQLPAVGEGVMLHTHLVVREDAQLLYGFASTSERELFRALIKVNGVGPKVALAILSGVSADEFVLLVNRGDAAALTRIPGIGKKTAERLLLDMRDRLKEWQTEPVAGDGTAGPASNASGGSSQPDARQLAEEAETALIALGYRPAEATKMIVRVQKDNPGVVRSEELIRLALQRAI
jgi:Holliday junction DNA helicase RuvA